MFGLDGDWFAYFGLMHRWGNWIWWRCF